MYFGSSRDSIGIQLADLCGYFISQHLQNKPEAECFYKEVEQRIFFSEVKPDEVDKSL
jgi:hypothetical protein